MKEKGIGGGNTITGLNFENESNILSLLEKTDGYSIKDNIVYYKGKEVARSYAKHSLYKYLETRGLDYKNIFQKNYCLTKPYML